MCKSRVLIVAFLLAAVATSVQAVTWDRAVYWDARYPTNWQGGGTGLRDALVSAGYTQLDADQLKTWMDGHITDQAASVVVFCRDIAPATVIETESATCTLRRYLDAGGKIVFYADIPFYNQGQVDGTNVNWGTGGSVAILGLNAAGGTWDSGNTVTITPDGADWGLTQTWASARPALAADVDVVLAKDNAGNAAAWVKHYVPGDTYRGFVRLYDVGGEPIAADVQRVAEFVSTNASSPVPADGALVTTTSPILEWTPSEFAESQQFVIGTDYDTVANATSGAPTIMPGQQFTSGLEKGKIYYWKIIGINSTDPASPYLGHVWSFTIAADKATQPDPADGATYQLTDLTLSWIDGIGKKYNQVYIGTDFATVESSETPVASPTANNYHASGLANGTTIYWRVDTVTAYHWDSGLGQLVIDSKAKGDVWSFTTVPSFVIVDPNLRGWWALDEDSGLLTLDQSGYGNHGMLMGNPTWTSGYDGGGLEFDGNGDWVDCGSDASINLTGEVSFAAWIKLSGVGVDQKIGGNQNGSSGGYKFGIFNDNRIEFEIRTSANAAVLNRAVAGGTYLTTDTWYHIAGVYSDSGDYITTYVNGAVDRTMDTTEVLGLSGGLRLGREPYGTSNWFNGIMDDVRLYSKALTQEQVQLAMRGDTTRAYNPMPAHQSTVSIDNAMQLSWSAGDIAQTHDVYFSTDQTAVMTGAASAFLGNQSTTTKAVNTVMGNTYFWRIDEHNSDSSVSTGRVWRFTIPAYRIVDDFESYGDLLDFGVDGQRLWFVWWDGFGYGQPVEKQGNGSGSVVDRSTAIADGNYQAMSMTYDGSSWVQAMTADLPINSNWSAFGTAALNLRFRGYRASLGGFSSAGAGQYNISSGQGDIWGTADVFHFAYVQMDTGVTEIIAKVESLTAAHAWAKCGVMVRDTLDAGSAHAFMAITPGNGAAFQWRPTADAASLNTNIDAGVATAPIWLRIQRDIGGLASGSYSLDGSTWTDVWGPNDVTVSTPMYAGVAISANANAAGAQAVFSNVTINGNSYTNFQDADIGVVANVPDNLYVELSDGVNTKQVFHPDNPNAILNDTWQDWDIALSEFSPVNTSNVQSITIGVTGAGGGTGTIYVDNIRLYRPRYVAGKLPPWPEDIQDDGNGRIDLRDAQAMFADWLESDEFVNTSAPASASLVAHFPLDGNTNDVSGNGHNGTPNGGPTYGSGMYSQAIVLDGVNDYVSVGAVGITGAAARTVAGWARADTTTIANWTDVFGFTNDLTANQGNRSFDIEKLGNWNFGYGIHVYGWERPIINLDLDWHHLAATYDGTTISWYGDGVLVGTEDRTLDTVDNVQMGKRGDNANCFPGSVDDVYIYDTALTREQISYLAANGAAQWYAPVLSPANISDDEPQGQKKVDFKDLAVLLDKFGETQVWP